MQVNLKRTSPQTSIYHLSFLTPPGLKKCARASTHIATNSLLTSTLTQLGGSASCKNQHRTHSMPKHTPPNTNNSRKSTDKLTRFPSPRPPHQRPPNIPCALKSPTDPPPIISLPLASPRFLRLPINVTLHIHHVIFVEGDAAVSVEGHGYDGYGQRDDILGFEDQGARNGVGVVRHVPC
jgi:hypothetical protein